MDKKNLTAVILCVIFYLGYTQYLKKKYPKMGETQKTVTTTQPAAKQNAAATTTSKTPQAAAVTTPAVVTERSTTPSSSTIKQLPTESLSFSGEDLNIVFDQKTSGIKSIVLKKYNETRKKDSAPVQLAEDEFFVQGLANKKEKPYSNYHAERQGNSIRFWKTAGNWEISQKFSIPASGYGSEVMVTWKNISSQAADLDSTVMVHERINVAKKKEKSGSFLPGAPTGRPMILNNFGEEDTDRVDLKSYCKDDEIEPATTAKNAALHFFGVDHNYFQKVFIPQSTNLNLVIAKYGATTKDSCAIASVVSQPQGMVAPGQTITMKFNAWFGPKEMDTMKAFAPSLENSVDLGFFGFLSKPLFTVTEYAHSATGNWGVAIILVTLALKLLFFPLNQQAAISMNKMKKLQPEMNKIREKHKEDKAKQQQEIMKFMSTNKINPMKGCLPILPQIPVFFSFYRVLSSSIELRHAPFFGWIQDLSAADPYYITPLLLGVAMYAQQKMNPTTGVDPAQAKMMMMMPVIFTVMMLSLPSGMVLYMLVNTIVSVSQQQWLNRRLA